MLNKKLEAGYVRGAVLAGVTLFALGVVVATTARAVRPAGLRPGECRFNSDCAYPLICQAKFCREECSTSRDCTGGWVCVQYDTPPSIPGKATGTVVDPAKKMCVDPAAFAVARPTFEQGVNYPGNDLGDYPLPVANPAACDEMCLETGPTCKGWTYVKPNVQSALPRCWLKSKMGVPAKDTNTVSGKR